MILRALIAWMFFVCTVFGLVAFSSWFIAYCFRKENEWWGGFPLWTAGFLGLLLPIGAVIVLATLAILGVKL